MIEPPREDEPVKAETPKNEDEHKIKEIIQEEAEKPKPDDRERVTCEKCGKSMLTKN